MKQPLTYKEIFVLKSMDIARGQGIYYDNNNNHILYYLDNNNCPICGNKIIEPKLLIKKNRMAMIVCEKCKNLKYTK